VFTQLSRLQFIIDRFTIFTKLFQCLFWRGRNLLEVNTRVFPMFCNLLRVFRFPNLIRTPTLSNALAPSISKACFLKTQLPSAVNYTRTKQQTFSIEIIELFQNSASASNFPHQHSAFRIVVSQQQLLFFIQPNTY
jgi:hypothetical protein